MTDPEPVEPTEPVGLTDEEIRVKALDHAVGMAMRFGEQIDNGGIRRPPSIWSTLDQADKYFRYIKNGAYTPQEA